MLQIHILNYNTKRRFTLEEKDFKQYMYELKSGLDVDCEVVFFCIGTDRVIGDSLGPIIGSLLIDRFGKENVYGDLFNNITFENIGSTIEKIKNHDFKIMLESILYHDIGRTNDIDDEFHGYNAINKLDFLKEKYNNTEYNIICAIITGHCIDDKHHNKVAEYFNVKNKSKNYKLLSLVKDADALDRVREYPYIDIKFLRNNTTKKLVPFAYEFFYNYENN